MSNDLLEQMVVHQEMLRRAHEAAVWRQAAAAAAVHERQGEPRAAALAGRVRLLFCRMAARPCGRQTSLVQ